MPADNPLNKFTLPNEYDNRTLNNSPFAVDYSGIIYTYNTNFTAGLKKGKKLMRTLRPYEYYYAKKFKELLTDSEKKPLNNNTDNIYNVLNLVSDSCSFHKHFSDDFKWMRALIAKKAFEDLGWQSPNDPEQWQQQLQAKVNFLHECRNRPYDGNDLPYQDIAQNVNESHINYVSQLKSRGHISVLSREFLRTVANCKPEILNNNQTGLDTLRQTMARWGAFYNGRKGVKNRLRLIIDRWSNIRDPNLDDANRSHLDSQFIQALGRLAQAIDNNELDYNALYNVEKDEIEDELVTQTENFVDNENSVIAALQTKQRLRNDPNMSRIIEDINHNHNILTNNDFRPDDFKRLNLIMSRSNPRTNRLRQLFNTWTNDKQSALQDFNKALTFLSQSLQSTKNDNLNDHGKITTYKRLKSKFGESAVKDGKTMLKNYHVDYDRLTNNEKDSLIKAIGQANNYELKAKQQLAHYSIKQFLLGHYKNGLARLDDNQTHHVLETLKGYINNINDVEVLDNTMAALQKVMNTNSSLNMSEILKNDIDGEFVRWLFQQHGSVNQLDAKVTAISEICDDKKNRNQNTKTIIQDINQLVSWDHINNFDLTSQDHPSEMRRKGCQYDFKCQLQDQDVYIDSFQNSVLDRNDKVGADIDNSKRAIRTFIGNDHDIYQFLRDYSNYAVSQKLMQSTDYDDEPDIVRYAQTLKSIYDHISSDDEQFKMQCVDRLIQLEKNDKLSITYDQNNNKPCILYYTERSYVEEFFRDNPVEDGNGQLNNNLSQTLVDMHKRNIIEPAKESPSNNRDMALNG